MSNEPTETAFQRIARLAGAGLVRDRDDCYTPLWGAGGHDERPVEVSARQHDTTGIMYGKSESIPGLKREEEAQLFYIPPNTYAPSDMVIFSFDEGRLRPPTNLTQHELSTGKRLCPRCNKELPLTKAYWHQDTTKGRLGFRTDACRDHRCETERENRRDERGSTRHNKRRNS